jgi:condensin complex subunit 1
MWTERYETICAELAKVDTMEMEKARQDAGMSDEGDEDDEDEDAEEEERAVREEEEGDDDDEENPRDAREGSVASNATARPAKKSIKVKKEKKEKKAPRPSQLDLAAITQEASQTSLSHETITKLRLTKKYYSDALRFITQIENAVPTLCQLLVSKNTSEVLEAMRFFRTSYEYDVVGSEKGIKVMLHLIWNKDVNAPSIEEGAAPVAEGKGVRASLIDVYRSLYFDVVPDLTPKQQVNRIAKNMIE